MSEELTFRDFAAAIMSNELNKASAVLTALLGLDPDRARGAAEHFQRQMSGGPTFMMKAMGMRQVVEGRDEAKLRELVGELFGLSGADCDRAVTTVSARFP